MEVFDSTLSNLAVKYSNFLGLKITDSSIKKDIEGHPNYPSLLSLSDTFTKYQVTNNAFVIDKSELEDFITPFIAYVTLPKVSADFVLVTEINNAFIICQSSGLRSHKVTRKDFLEGFKNIVWVAEPDKNSAEFDYSGKLSKEKKQIYKKNIGITTGIVCTLLLIVANIPLTHIYSFFFLALAKILGLSATVLLLTHSLNKDNSYIKSICNLGKKTNCDAVLYSDAATFINISWSELGFYYFCSTFFFLLTPTISFQLKVPWIAFANIITLPYVVFSIYYQAQIIKRWCLLCLIVQLAFVLEFLLSFFLFWNRFSYPTLGVSVVLTGTFCILLSIFLFLSLMPLFTKAKDAINYTNAYTRILRNPVVFDVLLRQEQKIEDGWQHLGIDYGNTTGKTSIVKVCNPYCIPCSKGHLFLEDLKKTNPNVTIKIILLPKDRPGEIISQHFLSLARSLSPEKLDLAINDWYLSDSKNYESFAERYPLYKEYPENHEHLELVKNWCEKMNITYTPTYFIDGFRLPKSYSISDLKYLL